MRQIMAPRKLPVALVTIFCIYMSAMYVMEIGMFTHCTCDAQNEQLQKSLRRKSHDPNLSIKKPFRIQRTLSPKHHGEGSQEKPHTPRNDQEPHVRSRDSESENTDNSMRPTPSRSRLVQTDDVLSNVSFTDLSHVIEIDSLNLSSIRKWTNAHKEKGHRNAFQDPPWVHKGDRACDQDTELVILMPATPSHAFIRELIRQTWASPLYGMRVSQVRPSSLRTKLAFIVGNSGLPSDTETALEREALRYGDMIVADFVDSYRNLSLKVMAGLNWARTFCPSAKYVMKADLDTYVNLPLLSKFLQKISEKVPQFIIGHRHSMLKHLVHREGRWAVAREDYPFDQFPTYLLGSSYVITGNLVPSIVSAGKKLPLIPIEDAFITGVVARIIHAPLLHCGRFANVLKTTSSCQIVYNYEMTVTKMSFSDLIWMWRDVLTNICSEKKMSSGLE